MSKLTIIYKTASGSSIDDFLSTDGFVNNALEKGHKIQHISDNQIVVTKDLSFSKIETTLEELKQSVPALNTYLHHCASKTINALASKGSGLYESDGIPYKTFAPPDHKFVALKTETASDGVTASFIFNYDIAEFTL